MEKTKQNLFSAGAESIDDFIKTFESLIKMFNKQKKLGIAIIPDSSTGVEINARFTVPMGGDNDAEYLTTDTGSEVNVPEEDLRIFT